MRSMPSSWTSIFSWQKACTASVWKMTLWAWAMAASSLMGSMVPISLLANMIDAMTVSGRMAASKAAGSTRPYLSTSR